MSWPIQHAIVIGVNLKDYAEMRVDFAIVP